MQSLPRAGAEGGRACSGGGDGELERFEENVVQDPVDDVQHAGHEGECFEAGKHGSEWSSLVKWTRDVE